jgi:hypothetical protein
MNKPTPEQMKQELIEEHRTMNVDYDDWAEHIYEWFEEYLAERGINWTYHEGGKTRDMSWSGFWSQGDGFAFSGCILQTDLKKYLGNKYPMMQKLGEEGIWFEASWGTHHRHNHTTPVSISHELFIDMAGDNPLAEVWDIELLREVENFETDLEEDIESLCKMMYRKLEEEYDYLTSDEQVWESIVANDLNSITNDEGEISWVSA